MTTINNLTALDTVVTADAFLVYSSANGDARRVSGTALLTFVNANLSASPSTYASQYSAPLTGVTVQVASTASGATGKENVHLIVTPAGTIAALTIKLPAVAAVVDKQLLLVNCTQIVTALTMDANGASAVVGAPTALTANGFFMLKYDALLSKWYRVG